MEIIDELTSRVQQAVREISDLRKERQLLASEVELLRSQVRDLQTKSRENERLKQDHEFLRARLLKLQRKIEKHLLVETTLAAQTAGGRS